MSYLTPGGALSLTYVLVSFIIVTLVIVVGRNNPRAALLLFATYFTVSCVYWIGMAIYVWNSESIAKWFMTPYDILMAVLTARLAHWFWKRWRNGRARRKGRVAGKVGVRLGRLVIIPEPA